MYPAIQQFEEGLLTPRESLRTLNGARFDRDEHSGTLRIGRTTLFAEVQCTFQGGRYLLCCPLSPLALRLAETSARRLKYRRADLSKPAQGRFPAHYPFRLLPFRSLTRQQVLGPFRGLCQQ